jgi:hypothetical protein
VYLCGVIKKDKTMTVVSTKEFNTHQEKYFDMALSEKIAIEQDNHIFHLVYHKSIEKQYSEQPVLEPDDDLRRAITAEELLERIHKRLDKKFETRVPA